MLTDSGTHSGMLPSRQCCVGTQLVNLLIAAVDHVQDLLRRLLAWPTTAREGSTDVVQLPRFLLGDTIQHNMWSVAKMCCASTTVATRMLGRC